MENDAKVKNCKKLYIENIACGKVKLLAHRKKVGWTWVMDYNLQLFLMDNDNMSIENIRLKFQK